MSKIHATAQELRETAEAYVSQLSAELDTVKAFLATFRVSGFASNGNGARPNGTGRHTNQVAAKVKARFMRTRQPSTLVPPIPVIPWFKRGRTPTALTVSLYEILQTPHTIEAIMEKTGTSRKHIQALIYQTNERLKLGRDVAPYTHTATGEWILHAKYRKPSGPVDTN